MTVAILGGVSNRDNEEDMENQMVENIRAELYLKRTLPTVSVIVKDDIVLNEDVPYTVALIHDTLKNLKIQVEEDT